MKQGRLAEKVSKARLDHRYTFTSRLGNLASGKTFYQKIGENTFHTFLIHSEWLVFLEITSGPFFEEDTIFAPWSPDSGMAKAVDKFLERLAATGQAIPV